jgi:hypothetical protein
VTFDRPFALVSPTSGHDDRRGSPSILGDFDLDTINNRARDIVPSVLLTLLSIIQALALELLWSRLRETAYLWTASWESVLGWAQVFAMVLGFLQVWLFYTSIVMRFRWAPSLRDSILPFVIGILEFSLIELMGPDSLGPWFYTIALVFAVSVWTSQEIYQRARHDPENSEFFEKLKPATLRDFVPSIVSVGGLALIGVILQVSGSRGWFALAGFVIATGMLAYQIELTRRYWNLSMSDAQS